ncbi:hypothetical protein BDR03DRAFT_980921 [Suillus americanus]|nr:hypothetical protein BDR03DRAFT_980921 [Suillus americanus]
MYLANETLTLSRCTSYFEIFLANQKGWQKKVDKGQWEADLRSNHYKIYPHPDVPACDSFFWMMIWIKWLKSFHYGCTLLPNDFLFPAMSANGAGIRGNFSTHCFRRGGAQYWFMFAPVGQRWTLAKVHWWGGWADGEHDWPWEWYQGANRRFASKYHQRATIALEFINQYESNEARFLAAYPEAELGHTQLLKAINKARTARGDRTSHNK